LAIKILENQGIECTAVTFETPFFSAKNSKKHSKTYGIDLRTINFSERHFGIVKNPPN
jgi:tRNA-uridine 2-sulfurtransferase